MRIEDRHQTPGGLSRRVGSSAGRLLLSLAAILCLGLPAAGQEVQEAEPSPRVDQEAKPTPGVDPEFQATHGRLDRFNMHAAGFNYWVSQHAVKPLAKGYNFIVPKFGQRGIENFLINLDRPRDIVNSLLQAKAARAGRHLGSLLLNTTLGVGGLFYVSDDFFVDAPPETFSETLGVWGVPTGPYIVLPLVIITDTSPRGIVGNLADGTMHPLFWLGYAASAIGGGTMLAVGASVRTGGGLNTVATLMPSPWFGSESEWRAFEELFAERTPYPEKKQLYFDNQRLDVED